MLIYLLKFTQGQ